MSNELQIYMGCKKVKREPVIELHTTSTTVPQRQATAGYCQLVVVVMTMAVA
jgi:hypothetical protein